MKKKNLTYHLKQTLDNRRTIEIRHFLNVVEIMHKKL